MQAALGFVVVRRRDDANRKADSVAAVLVDELNADCINAELASARFPDNGDFGQRVIVDNTGQHADPSQNISGAQPLTNPDISMLVGDAL